jgi:hypothetical protein
MLLSEGHVNVCNLVSFDTIRSSVSVCMHWLGVDRRPSYLTSQPTAAVSLGRTTNTANIAVQGMRFWLTWVWTRRKWLVNMHTILHVAALHTYCNTACNVCISTCVATSGSDPDRIYIDPEASLFDVYLPLYTYCARLFQTHIVGLPAWGATGFKCFWCQQCGPHQWTSNWTTVN